MGLTTGLTNPQLALWKKSQTCWDKPPLVCGNGWTHNFNHCSCQTSITAWARHQSQNLGTERKCEHGTSIPPYQHPEPPPLSSCHPQASVVFLPPPAVNVGVKRSTLERWLYWKVRKETVYLYPLDLGTNHGPKFKYSQTGRCGLMDKASDFGSGDCQFESGQRYSVTLSSDHAFLFECLFVS